VALDADTQFDATTISRLVRWFTDPAIGAVAGNAKVGNRINMITRWQALEYIVAQNLERRALSALDTLTVVPGAVGAWRRDVLKKIGGFPADTLAEDQDLTIAIQTLGYRVQFDSTAIAWTEAPATVRGLAKQRFRWAYGTLQCLWKYRRITFNPAYEELGLVALPQVWLFQIVLTTLAPVADLLLLWQLAAEYINYAQHVGTYTGDNLKIVGVYYAVFILVDILAAMAGFLLEKGEDWRLLWWLPLQRFGYRQIMYYVVLRSLWTALRGPFVGVQNGRDERVAVHDGREDERLDVADGLRVDRRVGQTRPVPQWQLRFEPRVHAALIRELPVVVFGRVQRLMRVFDVVRHDRREIADVVRAIACATSHGLEGLDELAVHLRGAPWEAAELLDLVGAVARDVGVPIARHTRERRRLAEGVDVEKVIRILGPEVAAESDDTPEIGVDGMLDDERALGGVERAQGRRQTIDREARDQPMDLHAPGPAGGRPARHRRKHQDADDSSHHRGSVPWRAERPPFDIRPGVR